MEKMLNAWRLKEKRPYEFAIKYRDDTEISWLLWYCNKKNVQKYLIPNESSGPGANTVDHVRGWRKRRN